MRADKGKDLHAKLGRPGAQAFRKMIGDDHILNFPHASRDNKNTEATRRKYVSTVR